MYAILAGFFIQAIGAPPRNPMGPGMPLGIPNMVYTAGAGLVVDKCCRRDRFDWDWQALKSAGAGMAGALAATSVKLTVYGRNVKPLAQSL